MSKETIANSLLIAGALFVITLMLLLPMVQKREPEVEVVVVQVNIVNKWYSVQDGDHYSYTFKTEDGAPVLNDNGSVFFRDIYEEYRKGEYVLLIFVDQKFQRIERVE